MLIEKIKKYFKIGCISLFFISNSSNIDANKIDSINFFNQFNQSSIYDNSILKDIYHINIITEYRSELLKNVDYESSNDYFTYLLKENIDSKIQERYYQNDSINNILDLYRLVLDNIDDYVKNPLITTFVSHHFNSELLKRKELVNLKEQEKEKYDNCLDYYIKERYSIDRMISDYIRKDNININQLNNTLALLEGFLDSYFFYYEYYNSKIEEIDSKMDKVYNHLSNHFLEKIIDKRESLK
jgi:hypothetical protein